VGGIYTVLKTKAQITCEEYGDRYVLIGPLNYKSALGEVEPVTPTGAIADTLKSMEQVGVKWLYGRWLIEGASYTSHGLVGTQCDFYFA
jgi:glycogen(starch) synthase